MIVNIINIMMIIVAIIMYSMITVTIFEELNDWLDSGASRPCWQLAVDSCVV